MTYLEFLRDFELYDPEPPLDEWIKDKFDHIDGSGRSLGEGRHWRSELVDAHVAWHRRFTNEYTKRRSEIHDSHGF